MTAKVNVRLQHSFGCYFTGFLWHVSYRHTFWTTSDWWWGQSAGETLGRTKSLYRMPAHEELQWAFRNGAISFFTKVSIGDFLTFTPMYQHGKISVVLLHKSLLYSHPFPSRIGNTPRTHRLLAASTLLKCITKAETKGLKRTLGASKHFSLEQFHTSEAVSLRLSRNVDFSPITNRLSVTI